MAVSFIPLVGPLISCVIDGTFVDMLNAIKNGDWATLGMCALAFVPGMKQAKMGLKAFGAVEKAGIKGEKLFTKSNFRKNLIEATGKNPGKSMEAHHVLPQAHEKFFASKGLNIHDTKYAAWKETKSHRTGAYAYNKAWEDRIASGDLKTVNDIEDFARTLGW